jgi:ABC-type phosphate/phosphonate transport system substrate-binding protein
VRKQILSLGVLSLVALASVPNVAAPGDEVDASVRKASYSPPVGGRGDSPASRLAERNAENGPLILSAPPRESRADAMRIYPPIAQFLAQAIGRPVEYRHPDNWLQYQTEMLKGGYDIVFDGPHLNSWRISNLRHNALAKLADENVIAVIVRKNDDRFSDLKQLVARGVCSLDPPDLGVLAVMAEYSNPMRVPAIIDSATPARVFENVVEGKRCVAGILPVADLKKFDPIGRETRVIYRSKPMPNQAFSAGPRVTAGDQAKIAAALLSSSGATATEALRTSFGATLGFAPASRAEFAGLDSYLKDAWAYTR